MNIELNESTYLKMIKIQSLYRKYYYRKKFLSMRKAIIKVQSYIRKFIMRSKFNLYLINLLNKNINILEECFKEILIIMKKYPPIKNEYKFIYGKLIEKSVLDNFNKILECKELETYINDLEFVNFKQKYSIKATKNGSEIIIINKKNRDMHFIKNVKFIICNIKELSFYIFSHNQKFNYFIKNNGSCISYKSSIFSFIKKNYPNNIINLSNNQNLNHFIKHELYNIVEHPIYDILYNDIKIDLK